MRPLDEFTNQAISAIREIGRRPCDARERAAALERIGACLGHELELVIPEVCVLTNRDGRRERHVRAR